MRQFFRDLFRGILSERPASSARGPKRARIGLEALEDRLCLSFAVPTGPLNTTPLNTTGHAVSSTPVNTYGQHVTNTHAVDTTGHAVGNTAVNQYGQQVTNTHAVDTTGHVVGNTPVNQYGQQMTNTHPVDTFFQAVNNTHPIVGFSQAAVNTHPVNTFGQAVGSLTAPNLFTVAKPVAPGLPAGVTYPSLLHVKNVVDAAGLANSASGTFGDGTAGDVVGGIKGVVSKTTGPHTIVTINGKTVDLGATDQEPAQLPPQAQGQAVGGVIGPPPITGIFGATGFGAGTGGGLLGRFLSSLFRVGGGLSGGGSL